MVKKYAENEFVILSIEKNILYYEYKPETSINLKSATEIMLLLTSLCDQGKYMVLQDMHNLKWIDKLSRDFFASHPITSQMIAWAYVAKQPIHHVMYTIYVTFSKPEVETGFFQSREQGIKWLLEVEKLKLEKD